MMPLAEAASGARSSSDPEELTATLRFLARMNAELARMQAPQR